MMRKTVVTIGSIVVGIVVLCSIGGFMLHQRQQNQSQKTYASLRAAQDVVAKDICSKYQAVNEITFDHCQASPAGGVDFSAMINKNPSAKVAYTVDIVNEKIQTSQMDDTKMPPKGKSAKADVHYVFKK